MDGRTDVHIMDTYMDQRSSRPKRPQARYWGHQTPNCQTFAWYGSWFPEPNLDPDPDDGRCEFSSWSLAQIRTIVTFGKRSNPLQTRRWLRWLFSLSGYPPLQNWEISGRCKVPIHVLFWPWCAVIVQKVVANGHVPSNLPLRWLLTSNLPWRWLFTKESSGGRYRVQTFPPNSWPTSAERERRSVTWFYHDNDNDDDVFFSDEVTEFSITFYTTVEFEEQTDDIPLFVDTAIADMNRSWIWQ